mmetsp:Transcript_14124/g.56296  ORF Transcript_14124/g.56296 Transcript_14124/m.56296 type:complete len:248 (-) Transcript_14124:896-1639(-)
MHEELRLLVGCRRRRRGRLRGRSAVGVRRADDSIRRRSSNGRRRRHGDSIARCCCRRSIQGGRRRGGGAAALGRHISVVMHRRSSSSTAGARDGVRHRGLDVRRGEQVLCAHQCGARVDGRVVLIQPQLLLRPLRQHRFRDVAQRGRRGRVGFRRGAVERRGVDEARVAKLDRLEVVVHGVPDEHAPVARESAQRLLGMSAHEPHALEHLGVDAVDPRHVIDDRQRRLDERVDDDVVRLPRGRVFSD